MSFNFPSRTKGVFRFFYIQKLRLWGNGLKKHQTTLRPSEQPPVMGEKISKRLVNNAISG